MILLFSIIQGTPDAPVAAREFLRSLYAAAVEAVSAARCLKPFLPEPPRGRTIVIGAGKGAAAMAAAVEQHWQGDLSGMVVTRYGHGMVCKKIDVVEAAHPVPDAAGQQAAARMLQMVQGLSADDLVLCLISGGGSSLLSLPAEGITLAQKQALNKALLKSGATIFEMNCVRKHLSAIKGGRLALACAPARVVTLLISDIPGDDPAIIASGPTLTDAGTCSEALAILRKYAIEVPPAVEAHLTSGAGETPKPGDPRFEHNRHHVIATAQDALEAAAALEIALHDGGDVQAAIRRHGAREWHHGDRDRVGAGAGDVHHRGSAAGCRRLANCRTRHRARDRDGAGSEQCAAAREVAA